MKKFDDIKPFLHIAACVLIVFLFMNVVGKKRKPASTDKIEALYERLVKVEQEKVVFLEKQNQQLSEQLKIEKQTDSLLLVSINNNKPKYESNAKKLQAVGPAVNNLDREQLRRAFTNY